MTSSSRSDTAIESSVSSFTPGCVFDEEKIELEAVDELLEAVVEHADVVAFAQNAANGVGVDARRDEIQPRSVAISLNIADTSRLRRKRLLRRGIRPRGSYSGGA